MKQANTTKHWWVLIIRGLIYVLIGASLLLDIRPFSGGPSSLVGSLLISAGACGVFYGIYSMRADRNYFWELLRSIFDIGFGIAFLFYARGDADRFLDIFGFWAVVYAFVQAVQAMYIFMLAGVKQPRNIFGNIIHFLNVVLSGGLAFELLTSSSATISIFLCGFFVSILGLIIIGLAIQQRQTPMLDNPL